MSAYHYNKLPYRLALFSVNKYKRHRIIPAEVTLDQMEQEFKAKYGNKIIIGEEDDEL